MKTYLIKTLVLSLATAIVLSVTACSSGGGSGGDATTDDGASGTTASIGSAALSGTLADSTSVVSGAPSRFVSRNVTDVDLDASAELVVDFNRNGVFGDSEDKKYSSVVGTNGAFEFSGIEVVKEGITDAQLTVSKTGFAAVTKIISLSDGQNASIVTQAGTMAVFTQVVKIDKDTTAAGSYLKIGMKNTSSGVSSYAKIMSLGELRAEAADVSLGEDDLSTSVFPLDAVPDGVTEIKADMKAFDPTDEEDSRYFPGEYEGVGKDGSAPSRLVSVGFDLVSLRDQNGDLIELDNSVLQTSKLRPQAITWENCLQTKVRYLGATQVELIERMGDDDNTTPDVFEIPMWYYNSSAGNWAYLGDAEYVAATSTDRAYATMCITENWGEYLNLDYDFAITQPKTVCVSAKDQDGGIVNNLSVYSKKDTAYDYKYLDSDGKTTLALTAGDDLSTYEFYYAGSLTSWTNIEVDSALVVANTSDDACDYDLDIVVQNPYSTTLQVSALDIEGTIGSGYVYVYNNSYNDYFYKTAYLDSEGKATFKIKPNTSYVVRYLSKEVDVNANGAVVAPETADSTRAISVLLQDANIAPEVSARFNNRNISENATSVRFSFGANDANGDAITFESLTLNGVTLVEGTHYTVTSRYLGVTNRDYVTAVLDLENAEVSAITPSSLSVGSYSLVVSYTDGTLSGTGSATLSVAANRAPIINGLYLYSATSGYVNLRDAIDAGTYTLSVYAYDPNGDAVTLSYTLDGNAAGDSVDLTDGEHTIVVNASDGTLSSSKSFTLFVGDNPPRVTYAGAESYLVDKASTDNTINLFAYVYDKEDGSEVASVQASDQNGTTYTFTYNTARGMYEAELTPAFVGNYVFDINATDSGGNTSKAQNVSVQVIENNQVPIFTTELVSEVINVNTSKTFTCEATDPEETFVTYVWMIGDEAQTTASTTLTHTFSATGQVSVSCTATDGDGESATTNALMTVVDPTQTGTLVVNTEMPGLVVALHDMETMEPLEGQEKVTDASGSASFAVVGDRVTFSISLTSDTVMSESVIMDEIKIMLVAGAQRACSDQPDTNTTCDIDWCAAYDAETIPNWMVDLNPPKDENGTVVATADEVDTNNNGVADASEIFAVVLQMEDANSDGTITWSEFNDNEKIISTQAYSMVPVQTYNIPFSGYYDEWQHYDMDSICEEPELTEFNVTVTGLTPNTYTRIYTNGGSGWGSFYDDSNASGAITFKLSVYNVGADGNYTYLLTDYTDANKTYYLLEGSAQELQGGVSINVGDFSDPTIYEVLESNDESLYLTTLYNGFWLYTTFSSYVDSVLVSTIFEIPNAEYIIGTYKSTYVDGLGSLDYGTYNYYGDGTLQAQYNTADYPQLDIVASAGTDGAIEFGGSELSKVNLVEYSGIVYANAFTFNFSIVSTQAQSRMEDVNASAVLPTSVIATVENFEQGILSAYSGYSDISLTEYKDKTESELIDIFSNMSSDYAVSSIGRGVDGGEDWYFLPKRYISIYQYFEGEYGDGEEYYAPSRVQTDEVKKAPTKRPFSIGIDVSKVW